MSSPVVARIYNVDPESDVDISGVIALPDTPFPGDTVKLTDGRTIRVLRRQFIQINPDARANVDVELGARLA